MTKNQQFLTRRRVPNTNVAIAADRREREAIGKKRDAGYPTALAGRKRMFSGKQLLALFHIPEPHHPVIASRDQTVSVRGKREGSAITDFAICVG